MSRPIACFALAFGFVCAASTSARLSAEPSLFDSTAQARTVAEAEAAQEAWANHLKTEVVVTNSVGMKLRLIPPGEFLMGSTDADFDKVAKFDSLFGDSTLREPYANEQPQHKVLIMNAYYLGQSEVTQDQWKAVMGTEPWKGQKLGKEGPGYPATYVSWDDAVEYCRKLGGKEGKVYQLPTEAEWEYACRAGTNTTWSFGDKESSLKDYAWYDKQIRDIGEEYAHRMGQKKANPFGLSDMHGNVWEYCRDVFNEKAYDGRTGSTADPFVNTGSDFRVIRGGSWNTRPRHLRSAYRGRCPSDVQNHFSGFRVLRTE